MVGDARRKFTVMQIRVFSGSASGKESACNAGDERDMSLTPGWRRFPSSRKWQPAPVFLRGKFHGQRSLAGYSPRGCKKLDTTELMHAHAHICICSHTDSPNFIFIVFHLFLFFRCQIQLTPVDCLSFTSGLTPKCSHSS